MLVIQVDVAHALYFIINMVRPILYRNWSTIAASVFAILIIGGAYLIARGAALPRVAQASTETALLEQIASKDSTGDGLPDWEKSLYGIPVNATTTDYFNLGMTDGEAVARGLIVPVAPTPALATSTPGAAATAASYGLTAPATDSLTDTFAQNFFALYMSAEQSNGGSLTDDQINDIANEALTELSASVTPAPDFKSAADIKASGTGPAALKAYAANAEAVFAIHDPHLPENQLEYLQDYLTNGDQSALTALAELGAYYQETATGLAALTVPTEAATTHLALVNALARTGWEIKDFSRVNSDPLSAMLALEQHPQTVLTLSNAFTAVAQEFSAEGIVLPAGSDGAGFVNLASDLAAQATTTTP